jgi:hypothetical protein
VDTTETAAARIDRRPIWMRGLFMLLFLFAFGVGQSLLCFLALVQFIWLLSAGEANTRLGRFGKSLSLWLAAVGQFLTCASEEKPVPWADWPSSE